MATPQETLERLIEAAVNHGDREAPLLKDLMVELGLTQPEVEAAFQSKLSGEINETAWHLAASKIQTYNVPADSNRHFELITEDGAHHKVGLLFIDQFKYKSHLDLRQDTVLRRRDWRVAGTPIAGGSSAGTQEAILIDSVVLGQHQALYPGVSIKQLVTNYLKERIRAREKQLKQLQEVEKRGLDLQTLLAKVNDGDSEDPDDISKASDSGKTATRRRSSSRAR